jgi:hypothetical protein
MALASWRFVLTDTNFTPVGEVLNASERSVTLGLNRIDAASFKIRLDNPLADPLRFLSGYLKAYRNGTLMFFGPLITAEETADDSGAYVTVNAAGVGWVLTKRLAGKRQDTAGYQTWTATDRAEIVRQYISDILDREFRPFLAPLDPLSVDDFRLYGDTYINVDTLSMTAASAITYTVPPFKPFMELLNELSAGLGGFEWRIMPRENWSGGLTGIKIGNMTAAPVIGSDKPGAVFEFGVGRTNISSYTRSLSRDGQANRVYHLLSTGPLEPDPANPNPPVTQDSVTAATLPDWGIMEDVAQADLTNRTMRQQLVDEHGSVRQLPRSTIVFAPSADYGDGRLPEFGVEYNIGDTVRARARYGGIDRFNASFRVWGIQFQVNEFGVETPNLTLSEEGAA